MNTGTKTEPKFSAPVELKGTPVTPAIKIPNGWDINYGLQRGNYYAFAMTVTATDDPKAMPPEGKSCLHFGYQPSLDKIMTPPAASQFTGALDPKFERVKADARETDESEIILRNGPANMFLLRQHSIPVKVGQSYTMSFKVKGTVSSGQVQIGLHADLPKAANAPAESRENERGAVRGAAVATQEDVTIPVPFSGGSSWNEVKKDFKVTFTDKRFNEPTTVTSGVLEVSFVLQPMSGEVYFDDFKISPK